MCTMRWNRINLYIRQWNRMKYEIFVLNEHFDTLTFMEHAIFYANNNNMNENQRHWINLNTKGWLWLQWFRHQGNFCSRFTYFWLICKHIILIELLCNEQYTHVCECILINMSFLVIGPFISMHKIDAIFFINQQ